MLFEILVGHDLTTHELVLEIRATSNSLVLIRQRETTRADALNDPGGLRGLGALPDSPRSGFVRSTSEVTNELIDQETKIVGETCCQTHYHSKEVT